LSDKLLLTCKKNQKPKTKENPRTSKYFALVVDITDQELQSLASNETKTSNPKGY